MEMKDEIELKLVQKPKRHLKWYKKQFGAGFCYGLTVGCSIGALFFFMVDSLMRLLIG